MRDLPRIPLPTDAAAADLARLPLPVRRAALFSARLSRAAPLVEIGNKIKGVLDGGVSMSDARKAVRESLDLAGYVPPEGLEGTLRDHRSRARLDLILTQNVRRARGYARHAEGMGVLDQWPAQELVRVFHREKGRDWRSRWADAGGLLTRGRMVALKTDPVWAAVSRFGDPFPPFDYGSGMGLRDIGREEAEALGLIAPGETLTPEAPEYPDAADANMPGVERMPELRAAVERAMGPGAAFDGSVLRFISRPPVAGAAGSARTLGLPGLAKTSVHRSAERIDADEAFKQVKRGRAVTVDPAGNKAEITEETIGHWRENSGKAASRLPHLRRALDTIRDPQERWERDGKLYYLKATLDGDGRMRYTYVVAKDGRVVTWVSEARPGVTGNKRHGTLTGREDE